VILKSTQRLTNSLLHSFVTFQKPRLKHTDETESKAWLAGPKMKYWPQQLNFAVFCATQACGVSRDIFDDGVSLPPQIRAEFCSS